jgi:hypothetical protein
MWKLLIHPGWISADQQAVLRLCGLHVSHVPT